MISVFRRWKNKPLDRGKALSALFLNQLATPGLGSLLAGRKLAGSFQLLLAGASFALLMAWFIRVMVVLYSLPTDDALTVEPNLHHEWWKAGALLFAAAWLWSLVTSLGLLRQAREQGERELKEAGKQPPVIT